MDVLLMKGNHKILFLFILSSFIVFISGCSLLPKEEQALKPPLVQPTKESTQTYDVKTDTILKEIKGIGRFESTQIKYHEFIGSGGRVETVHVKSGDTVKKGDLLVQLAIEDLDLIILQQELDLERAKINLSQARQKDDAQTIRLREMEMEIAKLKFQKTSERIASKDLVAQMDGQVVFMADINQYDYINDNRVLVNIADTTQLRLVYEVSNSNNIASVQVGMTVQVLHQESTYTGTVVQTPSSAPYTEDRQLADKYSKSLYVNLDETPSNASMGDSAEISIITEQRENTIVIPRRGLRSYLGRNYVYILDGESRQEVDVEVGIETSTQVEILKGLQEGQKVILQ
jgi:multidrug efflux pump subunit AcrA (membrane-fusion protein)